MQFFRTRRYWLALAGLFFWQPTIGVAQDGGEIIPIAVVDFTASRPTAYAASLAEFVVDELVNTGRFDVVEREKLATIVSEVGFQSSGLVDPNQAVQVGGMAGAKLIVTGHVLDSGSQTQRYSGYGVTSTKTTYHLKARLEVVDVQTGSKIFSRVASANKVLQAVQGAATDRTQRDLGDRVARQLVDAMLDSDRIKNMTEGPEQVTVVIRSEPPDADVEIDGTFYGTSGQQIQIIPGIHEVVVSLPGYENWSKRVMMQEGTSILARLREERRADQEIQVDVRQGN